MEATHGAEAGEEATFLSLREISYSPNACLEQCGAHVKWQVLLTAVTMSLGGRLWRKLDLSLRGRPIKDSGTSNARSELHASAPIHLFR